MISIEISICVEAETQSELHLPFPSVRFHRVLNDGQTASLCLRNAAKLSNSIFSPSSKRSSSRSSSPSKPSSHLQELYKREQKKLSANALYLKSQARFHLGDIKKAKSNLLEAERELKFGFVEPKSKLTSASSSNQGPIQIDDLMASIQAAKQSFASFSSSSKRDHTAWLNSQRPTLMVQSVDSGLPAWFESEEEFEDLLEEMVEFWGTEPERNNSESLEVEEISLRQEDEGIGYEEVEMEDG